MRSYDEMAEEVFRRADEVIENQRVRRNLMKKRIIALSAFCLAVLIGIGVWQADLFKTKPIETPIDKTSSLPKENNEVTVPDNNKIIVPDNSGYYPDYTTVSGAGGDGGWWYNAEYNAQIDYLNNPVLRAIVKEKYGEEHYNEWLNQFWNFNKLTYTRLDVPDDIKIIEEFNITEEEFISYCRKNNLIVNDKYYFDDYSIKREVFVGFEEFYTKEQVDILFGDDKALRDKTFVNDLAIYANGKAYSPRWVCEHRAEDYIKAGMTKEQIAEKLELWKKEPTPITCDYNIDNFVYSHDKFDKMLLEVENQLARWNDALTNPSDEKCVDTEARLRYPNRPIIPSVFSVGDWVFNKYDFKMYVSLAKEYDFTKKFGKELVSNWVSQFYFHGGTRNEQEFTIYNFVIENDIDPEEFYSSISGYTATDYENNKNLYGVIFTDNESEINKAFVNETAIYANGEIYTPDWINRHTAEDYINAGISKEELLEKVEMWKQWPDVCEYFLEIENIEAEIAKMP